MRLNGIDSKRRTIRVRQPFSLTSREIMADLMYPAPVEAPKRRKGDR